MDEQAVSKAEKNRVGRVAFRPAWLYYLSIMVRAVHQLFAAFVVAAFFYPINGGFSSSLLLLVSGSGLLLFAAEGARHRQICREVTGVIMVMKFVLLGLAVHLFLPPSFTLVFLFLVSSFISHAPRNIRHRLLF